MGMIIVWIASTTSVSTAKIMWIKASAKFKLLGRVTCMQHQAKHTIKSSIIY